MSVGVAIVGAGKWGKVLADAAVRSGEVDVVSCFSRTPERRQEFAAAVGARAAASLEEVLNDADVEGVLIATSHSSHRAMIEAAAAAGKHVFVEKPLTLSVDDGRAAVDAAAAAGIVLQVGHQRRRFPAHRAMRDLIDTGAIGDIQLLQANHSLPGGFNLAPEAWRWSGDESPLGSMTSLGIHQIENFHYLAGPIARVAARTRRGREVSIDEATGLLFEFESGAIGTLVSSFFAPWDIRLSVHGTDGAAYSSDDGTQLEVQVRSERERTARSLPEIDGEAEQLTEFAAAVRGEKPPEVGGEEGLAVIAVLEAAVESANTGRFVDVR